MTVKKLNVIKYIDPKIWPEYEAKGYKRVHPPVEPDAPPLGPVPPPVEPDAPKMGKPKSTEKPTP